MKKILFTWVVGAVLITGATSCSGFLEEYSQDLAKVESWRDLDEVLLGDGYMQSGRVQVFDSYSTPERKGNLDILHFMSDELQQVDDNVSDVVAYKSSMFPFYTWQQDTGMDEKFKYVGGDETYWDFLYNKINICNMVIALIDEQPESNDDDRIEKERVKGEAYFLRGVYYFLLANLYSEPYVPAKAENMPGVPVKVTEFVEDTEFRRLTLAETYGQILEDLSEAERCLDGKRRASIYHANQTAALLLKSRVYLYMQNWEKAAEYAGMALDRQSALLDLHTKTPGENCIYKDSPETIFSMGDYMISTAFADRRREQPPYYLSDDMQALFDRNDLRSTLYVGETEHRGYPGVFMKVNGQLSKWGGYYDVSSNFLLRTPEAYLTLAEAAAYSGDEDTARQNLKTFLTTRMNGSVTVDEAGEELIALIRDERAREFLLEGHRWFDLRRYTVCEPYPWSKVIEHRHVYIADYEVDYIDYYRLEKNDDAYTLPIPREIRNFQNTLGNNSRPARKPFKTVTY